MIKEEPFKNLLIREQGRRLRALQAKNAMRL